MHIKFGMLINTAADFVGVDTNIDSEVIININVKNKGATITLAASEAKQLFDALKEADVEGLALCAQS